jgi:4-amino-4-deoxy-L-arabinose transferase-like glycosyltransferase
MIIFLLSIGLLFWNLGGNTLSNWDEALLAAVARDGGIWNGQRWWYEPPLVTWVLGLVTRLTDSEWWLRLPNAIASLILVMAVYRKGGLMAALILLSTIEFLFRARQINVDVPLALFLFLAVTRNSGLFLGLAAITKRASWLLAVPALIWALKNGHWKKELGLFLLVALSWHIWSYLKFGQEFIDKYLLGFTVGKLTSVNPVTGSSPWFYIETLKHGMKLWVLALPLALIWGWRQKTWLILAATYLIGLTLAPIKASLYLLPLYPVLALLIGGFLTAVFRPKPTLGLVLVITVALFNLLNWRQQWLVPQTTAYQAALARAAKSLTQSGDTVYLDDDWLPVAVFYSQRKVVPLRFNRTDTYDTALVLPTRSLVMTNLETVANLKTRGVKLETVRQINDLLLTRVK